MATNKFKKTIVKSLKLSFLTLITAITSLQAQANITVGEPAPDFKATDINGNNIKLSDLKGNIVVLEWSNLECPYVKKHYSSDNMQSIQGMYKNNKKVTWITVVSSAAGKQGYFENKEDAQKAFATAKSAANFVILDTNGEIGKLYQAAVTPHMFVIDSEGNLAYNGAIDDKPTADKADIAGAKNYVTQALNELLAGSEVSTPITQPYGCGVKY